MVAQRYILHNLERFISEVVSGLIYMGEQISIEVRLNIINNAFINKTNQKKHLKRNRDL